MRVRPFSSPLLPLLFAIALVVECQAAPPQGTWVNLAPDGRLIYARDSLGNRVPDFGDTGYKAEREPIPEAPVKVTLSPVDGDDRVAIQAAISQVAAMPADANGIRGAILLTAGEYQLSSTLNLNASGVVLRGEGASDTGTRLRATDPRQYTLVNIAGTGSRSTVSNTTKNITDKYVPVGARSFTVDNTTNLAAGHSIVVFRPCTQEWINALGMDTLDNPWTPGSRDISMERVITRIEGNRVFIDAPITTAIETQYGGGQIWRYTWSGRIQKSGIEDIKGISSFNASVTDDENHGWIFVGVDKAENCWARRVVSQYFGYACVGITGGSKFISVLDSKCLDPVSEITGGRRYAFNIDSSSQCLIWNCYTKSDRHQYVTGSDTPGPDAFVSSSSDNAHADAGPHHRWASALLYDRITVNGNEINARNRGNSGTGHGWAGGNCVVWNSKADNFIIQNPPTARNWLIGSVGNVSGSAGTFDSNGANIFPSTLWGNQRQDAQARPNLQLREYTVGDLDEFFADAGETTPVDGTWQSQVATQGTLGTFDSLQAGRWVPWTHTFMLSPGDTIVSATLWVSVRGMASGAQNGRIYFDDLTNSKLLSQYAPSIPTSGSTVLRIDLASELSRLADGKLNLAVQNNVAVDWSMLELRVAPALPGTTLAVLSPEADATVRGGVSAGTNFGSDTVLSVKEDASADNDSRGLLRWDLSGFSGKVFQAKIRLVPVSVGATDLENGAAIATSNSWTETSVTWNNQPSTGPRFVTWWPQVNQPVEFIVTSEVLGALSRDKKLSVQLLSARESAGVDYASKENPDSTKRPQLIIVTDGFFTLAATPPSRTLSTGNSTSYTVTMTTNPGFSGSVSFAVNGLPPNTTATFNPPSLSAAGSTTMTVNSTLGTPGGIYDLTITGTGASGTSQTNVSLAVATPGSDLIWNSTASTVWDMTSPNWFNEVTGTADAFQAGKSVTFTDRANVVPTVMLATGLSLTPSAVKVDADETDYTIGGTGKISGTTGLTKSGDVTLVINATNDYTGVTTLSGGILSVPTLANGGSASPIGSAASTASNLVLDGGTLRWTGDTATTSNRGFTLTPNGGTLDATPPVQASLTLSGSIAFSGSGDRTLTLDGTDDVLLKTSSHNLTATIGDGTGGKTTIVKNGTNAWNLSGASNTYSGGSTVNGGRLRANSANGFGTGPVAVSDGAQAYLGTGATFTNPFTIAGIGITETGGNYGSLRLAANNCVVSNTVTLAGNARITARLATTSGATISGKITGEYSLELGGSATANDAGITTQIPTSTNAFVFRGSADADQSEAQTLSTKRTNDVNARITYVRFDLTDILSAYTLEEIDSVSLRLYLTNSGSSESLRVYGLLDSNTAGTSDSAWTGSMTWNNQPAKTAAPNDIPNSATALPNANTTALLGSVSGFSAAGEVKITLDIASVRAWLSADTNKQITLIFYNTGSNILNWASLANTNGNLVPTLEVIGKPFGGAGGILTLSNSANDWSGQTTISHGTVRLGSSSALPHGLDAGQLVINNNNPNENSTLDLKGFSPTVNGLSSAGPVLTRCLITNTSTTASTLTVGDNNSDGDFGGVIQNGTGPIAFTKIGAGTQILGGVNTYTGSTIASSGLLIVNGSLANGPVTVINGATFGGNGILGGNLTVNAGGTVTPGNAGIGSLTVNNAVALQGNTSMELNKAAGTNDQIVSGATISYGGDLTIVNLGGSFTATDSFKLFTAATYSGTFTSITPAFPAVGLLWDTSSLNTTGTLKIAAATPIQTWRQLHFGTPVNAGNAADLANPAGDGIVNLIKYALAMDPTKASTTGLPTVSVAAGFLKITFNRNLSATDVTCLVAASDALVTWTTIASRTAGSSSWSQFGSTVSENNGIVTVVDNTPLTTQPRRFLKLVILRP
jgi:autotransporter-associated beta strand protein